MKLFAYTLAVVSFLLVPAEIWAQDTTPAFRAYYELKDALVATNPARAKTGALALVSAIKAVKVDALSSPAKKALNSAATQATAISKAADVEHQRKQFEGLSTAMIALAKGIKSAKAYVQYCPMAFDGKGAAWLSNKREVRNPYYGNKMLTCGSVKEEI